jgi:hypothetical protein
MAVDVEAVRAKESMLSPRKSKSLSGSDDPNERVPPGLRWIALKFPARRGTNPPEILERAGGARSNLVLFADSNSPANSMKEKAYRGLIDPNPRTSVCEGMGTARVGPACQDFTNGDMSN